MPTEAKAKAPCSECGKGFLNLSAHIRWAHPRPPEQAIPPPSSPVIAVPKPQTDGVRPGTIVGSGLEKQKVPYTYQYFWNTFPHHTFIPSETISVTINGVRVELVADQEITVPKNFYDVYMEKRAESRQRSVWRQPGDQLGVHVTPGAGPLPKASEGA